VGTGESSSGESSSGDGVTDQGLAAAFRQALQLARELKAEGAPPAERRAAIERILRANWPATPPERDWPWWARVPRCVRCDGVGLILETVVNRLGCTVEQGRPCTCQKGARYEARPAAAAPDYTAAGKVTPKPAGGLKRW
jgi:hypothetical protein